MIPGLLIAILPPLAVALFLARLAWRPHPGAPEWLLQVGYAFGLGSGISSCTYFLYMAGVRPGGWSLGSAEPIFFLCVLAGIVATHNVFVKRRLSPRGGPVRSLSSGNSRRERPNGASVVLSVAFCGLLACAVVAFILVVMDKPHGSGDATSIWNMRARFMFRGHDLWTRGFSPAISWSHPDYPLLLPASIARLWTYVGLDTPRVPQVLAGLFGAATVGVLFSSLVILRSVRRGLEAAVFLLAAAGFVKLTGWQYADVPLGFFILATTTLLLLGEKEREGNLGLFSLAGVMAGFAAWTKNEGSLFVLAALLAITATTLAKEGLRKCLVTLGLFAAGLLPVLSVLLFFKIRFAPPNDLFGSRDLGLLFARMLDFHRYVVIAGAFGKELLLWGSGLTAILAAYVVLNRVATQPPRPVMAVAGALAIALVTAGYFFVYVVTPHDLAWHIETSLERLLLQLWPTFLLLLFLDMGRNEAATG